MSEQRITLQETATEYLLFVPYSQKERAKRIEGRVWDRGRGCWVYPRIQRVHDAIVGEFGEEIADQTQRTTRHKSVDTSVAMVVGQGLPLEGAAASVLRQFDTASAGQRFKTTPEARLQALESSNEAYRQHLAEARSELQTLRARLSEAQSARMQPETQRSSGELRAERDRIEEQLEQAQKEHAERIAELDRAHGRVKSLESELVATRGELEKLRGATLSTDSVRNAQTFLLSLAIHAADENPQFRRILEGQRIDDRLVLTISNEMTRSIASLIPDGDTIDSLNKLLEVAKVHESLPADQLDLAHFVRRQRNMIVHGSLTRNSATVRTILVLFAASLLWPDLSAKNTAQ